MTLDEATATFTLERPRLLGIAGRVLPCVGEAEDIVQDAWLRWQRDDRGAVENPGAFLATTTTRLAINATRTARARHETAAISHLPEPVDVDADPTRRAETSEAIEAALREMLETLSSTERAAFVLREAFAYPYDRIATLVGTTEVNARQLVSRARRHLADDRRAPTDPDHLRRLIDAFLAAARHGDLATLEEVLRHDL